MKSSNSFKVGDTIISCYFKHKRSHHIGIVLKVNVNFYFILWTDRHQPFYSDKKIIDRNFILI